MSIKFSDRIANLENAVFGGPNIAGVAQDVSSDGVLNPAPGLVVITKSSACALTLVAPAADDRTTRLQIVSNTAYAHTITTASNVINGNASVATFGGSPGDAIEFRAYNGTWLAVLLNNVGLS